MVSEPTTVVESRLVAEGCTGMAVATEFTGEASFTTLGVTFDPDDPKNPRVVSSVRWAVCLFSDPDDPDGMTTADVIGFPGVASEGASRKEALDNAREALECAIEGLRGEDPPSPPDSYTIPRGGEVVYLSITQ